jgi:hypothetical protein
VASLDDPIAEPEFAQTIVEDGGDNSDEYGNLGHIHRRYPREIGSPRQIPTDPPPFDAALHDFSSPGRA